MDEPEAEQETRLASDGGPSFFASGDPTQARTGPAPRPDFSALDKQRAAFYIMPYKPHNGVLRHFSGNSYTTTWPHANAPKTGLERP